MMKGFPVPRTGFTEEYYRQDSPEVEENQPRLDVFERRDKLNPKQRQAMRIRGQEMRAKLKDQNLLYSARDAGDEDELTLCAADFTVEYGYMFSGGAPKCLRLDEWAHPRPLAWYIKRMKQRTDGAKLAPFFLGEPAC